MKQMYEIDCVICILYRGAYRVNQFLVLSVERKLDLLFRIWVSEYIR